MEKEKNGGQGINWQQTTNYCVVMEQELRQEITKIVTLARYTIQESCIDFYFLRPLYKGFTFSLYNDIIIFASRSIQMQ